jgi:acetyl esterase/lipase
MHPLRATIALCVAFSTGVNFPNVAAAEQSYKITPDVIYGHKAGMALTFDVIHPKAANGAGVMFMMSGAWVSPWVSPELLVGPEVAPRGPLFRELLEAGYTLFIVRHGSAPQFKVPEAVSDVRRAARYIRLHAEKFGVDPARIGACGASAGGHLSLMLGTTGDDGDGKAEDPIDRSGNRVAAVVAYFPPVDLREWVGDERFAALHFDPKLAESVSPLLHVTPDDAPTLLVHGDKDGLVELDNSERIRAVFQEHKVPCELLVIKDAGHGFDGDDGKRASKALIAWLDEHLASPKEAAADAAGEKGRAEKAAAAP